MPPSCPTPDCGGQKLPRLIYLTGVDGSGKSFIAEKLIAELKLRGLPVRHLWSRFNNIVSKPLLAFCRVVGLNYYETRKGTLIGYHDFEKSKIISWCFIICQIIDTWIATLFKIWPQVTTGKILVCDRGAYDTLIDVMVDTKKRELAGSKIAEAFLLLLPKYHKVFFLWREPEQIFRSRPDVKIDRNFSLRGELYHSCAARFGWLLVDNNNTPEETLNQILDGLCNDAQKENTPKLG
jgi:thymidylate kinase